jgi:hypothetical protein
MDNESTEKDYLEDLDDIICTHEMSRITEPFSAVIPEQAKVNPEMDHEKEHKEQSQQGHPYLFRDG